MIAKGSGAQLPFSVNQVDSPYGLAYDSTRRPLFSGLLNHQFLNVPVRAGGEMEVVHTTARRLQIHIMHGTA